jgi:hypothetical protein
VRTVQWFSQMNFAMLLTDRRHIAGQEGGHWGWACLQLALFPHLKKKSKQPHL